MAIVLPSEIQQEHKQEQNEAGPLVRKTLVIWYHETDEALLSVLDPHLQIVALRLKHFKLHYFLFPKKIPQPPTETDGAYTRQLKEEAIKAYQGKYATVLRGLSHAALFLPCVSPSFLLQFWKEAERDPHLQGLLTQPAFPIVPIPMRPLAGVANACLEQPLAAYPEGYEREMACTLIASNIEAALLHHYPVAAIPTQVPLLMLEAPRKKKRSRFSLFHRP